MRAEEVLERYQAGERNFKRVNLQGQSFKGKDLSGADFSEADIRGSNFTKANLKGANFSCARAGLQRRWAIGFLIISWLLSGGSRIFSAFAGYRAASVFDRSASGGFYISVVYLIGVAVFFILVIRQGLGAVAVAGTVPVAGSAAAVAVTLLSAYIG